MMEQHTLVLLVTAVMAVAAAMLAWLVLDRGHSAWARYRARFTEAARFQAQEFFLLVDPRRLFVVNFAVMALGAVLVWVLTGSIALGLAAFFGLALLPRFVVGWMRKRRLHAFEEQLPDALMMLSGGLRAGASLTSAIQQMAAESPKPLSQEFSLILREQRLGLSMEQCLNNLARRVPTPTTTLVVSAMRIASETGGGLAETLERTAHTIRSRLQMEGKIDALTAQGKLQAWVVGSLPLLLMLILSKMEPEAMGLLWTTHLGWATLEVLAFLEVMGVYLIRQITTIDV